MQIFPFDRLRRTFLRRLLTGGTLGLLGLPAGIRLALAMGLRDFPQGMRKIEGQVLIDDRPAAIGDTVGPGNVVTTGPDSLAIFVSGQAVYLLRDNSRLELSEEAADEARTDVTDVLKILNGKMLGVFGRKRRKRIITATAVTGIRGSGAYVEAEPDRTYFCLCYGIADISSVSDPNSRETVRTSHHESPRFIYGTGVKERITRAPVFNHTDAELIMLEAMVGRKPPFARSGQSHNY